MHVLQLVGDAGHSRQLYFHGVQQRNTQVRVCITVLASVSLGRIPVDAIDRENILKCLQISTNG